MTIIYSIIPCLYNEVGHHYSYHVALSNVFKINRWEDIKCVPKNCKINNLPSNWIKNLILYQGSKKRSIWMNIIKPMLNFFPFLKILWSLKKNKDFKKICFLEYFTLSHLFAFYLATVFIKSDCSLWLLYRMELDQVIFNGKAHRILHKLISKKIKNNRIVFFTDSALLVNQYESFFKSKFHVVPFPFIKNFQKEKAVLENKDSHFWWPGGSIREEKGLKYIQKLISMLKDNDQIKVVLAKCAKSFVNNYNKIVFVTTNLAKKEYDYWMKTSDLILLPYISNLYRYRTSGIFVEAVIAGSIPVVSKNTWMSYELEKYELSELAIDWDSTNIIEKLVNIKNDSIIKNKLKMMRQSYEKENSIQNYAFVLKSILDQTV